MIKYSKVPNCGFRDCVDEVCVKDCTRMREYLFMVSQEVAFRRFWRDLVPAEERQKP